MKLGERIAAKRKEQGMTQSELSEKMMVTRQTVSRWEAGVAYPDVCRIGELAGILGVSCDYLLTDMDEPESPPIQTKSLGASRLLQGLIGKTVELKFYDEECDADVLAYPCVIKGFEGNWMQVEILRKKDSLQKLILVSTILSMTIKTE